MLDPITLIDHYLFTGSKVTATAQSHLFFGVAAREKQCLCPALLMGERSDAGICNDACSTPTIFPGRIASTENVTEVVAVVVQGIGRGRVLSNSMNQPEGGAKLHRQACLLIGL